MKRSNRLFLAIVFAGISTLSIASKVTAQGGVDSFFMPENNFGERNATCATRMSNRLHNTVYLDSAADISMTRIHTVDRKNGRERMTAFPYVSMTDDSHLLEVSDTGPNGFINVAYFQYLEDTEEATIWLSADSGGTFSEVTLPTEAPYTEFIPRIIGGKPPVAPNFMKFGIDGSLAITYFLNNPDEELEGALYFLQLNKDGSQRRFQRLSVVHSYAFIDLSAINSVYTHTTVTNDNNLVVAFKPHKCYGWPDCADDINVAIGDDAAGYPGLMTISLDSGEVISDFHYGAIFGTPREGIYNEGPDGTIRSPILTTDGESIYIMSNHPLPQRTDHVLGAHRRVVHRLSPNPNGGYGINSLSGRPGYRDAPFMQLEHLTPVFDSADIPEPPNCRFGAEITGFAAERHDSDFTGVIDMVLYTCEHNPQEFADTLRLRIDTDVGYVGQPYEILTDESSVRNTRWAALLDNHGMVSQGTHGGVSTGYCVGDIRNFLFHLTDFS